MSSRRPGELMPRIESRIEQVLLYSFGRKRTLVLTALRSKLFLFTIARPLTGDLMIGGQHERCKLCYLVIILDWRPTASYSCRRAHTWYPICWQELGADQGGSSRSRRRICIFTPPSHWEVSGATNVRGQGHREYKDHYHPFNIQGWKSNFVPTWVDDSWWYRTSCLLSRKNNPWSKLPFANRFSH